MKNQSENNENQLPSPLRPTGVRLKVCGMNLNTMAVAKLQPQYLGFIFWKPSKRFFQDAMPQLPDCIKKVGVFVDASIEKIVDKTTKYDLQTVQLHGQENVGFCKSLKEKIKNIKIIKVFSISENFNFEALHPFEKVCDYYLFDTKGKLPGGNGRVFNWKVLKNYPSQKPYFLSGGIGLGHIESIKEFLSRPESKYCHAIDVNSKFETAPGLKDIEKLRAFKEILL
ncbi:Phosphoribosylanthranilate isomerase [hydrothermal vent metagenome]|uniref:phosphoribosylanthranilate isomerase n=1 Tax=hydrothermal vent metagenome TaxID=652676 RepID=A0A3B0U232_9ZZZZ